MSSAARESDGSVVVVKVGDLTAYAEAVFRAVGLRAEDAATVAGNLVLADLRGIDSHGVTRIPIYGERIQRGVVNRSPALRADRRSDALAMIDGDNGPGAVVGRFAINQAIALAGEAGVGIALARNSNHFGICADYALRAAEHGMIAMISTNSPPSMAVWGAREPLLGTNPWAFAAPVKDRPPIVLDFASSVVARGKIVERAKRRESIPEGWALNRYGEPTTDAQEGEAGVVLPFGGPKGSGIAVMVEILCGALTGAAVGAALGNLYKDFVNPQNIGHFFLVIDPRRALGEEVLPDRIGGLAQAVARSKRAADFDEVLLPGEPEQRLTERRRRDGVPVLLTTVAMLEDYARQFGIAFPQGTSAP